MNMASVRRERLNGIAIFGSGKLRPAGPTEILPIVNFAAFRLTG